MINNTQFKKLNKTLIQKGLAKKPFSYRDLNKIVINSLKLQSENEDNDKDLISVSTDIKISETNFKKSIELLEAQKKLKRIITVLILIGIISFYVILGILNNISLSFTLKNISGPNLSNEKWTYFNNFDNNILPYNWIDPEKEAKLMDGTLTIINHTKDYVVWDDNSIFSNFVYEARLVITSNTAKGSGIVFKLQDINNFYTFEINSKGAYRSRLIKNNTPKVLFDWETSPYINIGKMANLLRVECYDNTIKYYINNNLVKTIKDYTFLDGKIGFFTQYNTVASLDSIGVYVIKEPLTLNNKNWDYYWNFTDKLNNTNWPNEGKYIKFFNDMFTIYYDAKDNEDGFYYAWESISFNDFICEAKVKFIKGYEDGEYGICFRLSNDLNNFYRFGITPTGYYRFTGYKNDIYKKFIQRTKSDLINRKHFNLLKIEAKKGNFKLYINDKLVQEIQDNDYVERGKIGLYANYQVMAGLHELGVKELK